MIPGKPILARYRPGTHGEPDQIKGISRGLGPGPGPWARAWGPGQALENPLDFLERIGIFKARTGPYGPRRAFPGLSPWAQGPGPWEQALSPYSRLWAWIYGKSPLI